MAGQVGHVPAPPLHGCAEDRLVIGEQDVLPVGKVHTPVMNERRVVAHMPDAGHVVFETIRRATQHVVVGRLEPMAVLEPDQSETQD